MTLASTVTKVSYAGNGSTTAFAVPFMFVKNSDIEVIVLDVEKVEHFKTISTDYTLSGAGEQTGGVCTMIASPADGETLTIRRNPEIVQEVDYVENDAFPASTHEAALDKLTMICQALAERLDRAVSFRVSSASVGIEMPEPEAGRLLGWNTAGDAIENGPTTEEVANAQGYAEATALALEAAKAARDIAVAAAESIPGDPLDASDIGETVEPVDENRANRLYADTAALLQAVYGDQAQVHSGGDTHGLVLNRNHVTWTLTAQSGLFGDMVIPYDGTYVFHVYPNGNKLFLAAGFKAPENLPEPDRDAGEIRVVLERYNSRLSLINVQNMGV